MRAQGSWRGLKETKIEESSNERYDVSTRKAWLSIRDGCLLSCQPPLKGAFLATDHRNGLKPNSVECLAIFKNRTMLKTDS